jgi:hypothetical protein
VIFFSGGKLTVGMTVGTRFDFKAQLSTLNSFEFGRTGTLLIRLWKFIATGDIFLVANSL